MKLESAIGADDFMLDLNGMNEFIKDDCPSPKKNMFERNHTKDLQTLLVYTMPWKKKALKRMLTPMLSLLVMRYVYLMNKI